MAFILNKTALSVLRLNSQKRDDALALSRRGIHVKPGPRKKDLLEVDLFLKRFKPQLLKHLRDVATVVVVAASCYEIYDTVKEAHKKETQTESV